jgi:hypothetical protein
MGARPFIPLCMTALLRALYYIGRVGNALSGKPVSE